MLSKIFGKIFGWLKDQHIKNCNHIFISDEGARTTANRMICEKCGQRANVVWHPNQPNCHTQENLF